MLIVSPKRAAIAIGVALLGWLLYRAAVPSPSAYLDEFARLTGVRLDGEVIDRRAAFPDRRGEYDACMTVRAPPVVLPSQWGRGQPGSGLQPCTPGGARAASGAIHYQLSRDLPEPARIEIALDPAGGLLQARWHVRKRLFKP